ncbi:DUF3127 domain-containing protein [Blattabacterium cuenoti]|uniref:DUF3127 domain-containing protein n=1 Tax=Blattabacterium cuenoti TaxID=1653831 RepID=UPI00163CE216|nr:DUF3127 domain-containing protein [Blattabacterium cuenoti]
MEIVGKVKKIFDIQKFESGFKKREIVITTDDPYPQDILIEFIQDKTSLLESIKPNEKVKVFINIRGREWKNPKGIIKYFNSIQGWRIDRISSSLSNLGISKEDNINSKNSSDLSSQVSSDDFDDLPF